MLTMSLGLKNAFKSSLRRIYAKAIFHYASNIEIAGELIRSITADNTAPISLGGIQDDVLTIELMKDSLTDDQFNKVVEVSIYIGADVNGAIEYVYLGKYVSNYWKKDEETGAITVELVNRISVDAIIPKNIVCEAGGELTSYMDSVVLETYGEYLSVAGNVTLQYLGKSWLCYEKPYEQLGKMAEACNGLLINKDGFELIAYRKTTSIGTFRTGKDEELLRVTRISDYSDYKQQVSILKSNFNVTTLDKLASSNLTIKGEKQVIEIKTTGPIKVNYVIIGNGYAQFTGVTTGINWCNVEIYPMYAEGTYVAPIEVWGNKVQTILKDSKTVTDGSITYIENPYIQTTDNVGFLDTTIYEGVRYKLEYRGNPLYEVGDTISVDGIGDMLIYKRTLNFNGGLNGVLEAVLVDGYKIYPTNIIISGDNKLDVKQSIQLSLTFEPSTTTARDVVWSVDANATITQNGLLTAISEGACNVTVSGAGGIIATKTITIENPYLYILGDMRESITGGYVLAYQENSNVTYKFTNTTNGLYLETQATTGTVKTVLTVNSIDFTDINQIEFILEAYNERWVTTIGVGWTETYNYTVRGRVYPSTSPQTFLLDVSSITGQHKVGFSTAGSSTSGAIGDVLIKSIKLIK